MYSGEDKEIAQTAGNSKGNPTLSIPLSTEEKRDEIARVNLDNVQANGDMNAQKAETAEMNSEKIALTVSPLARKQLDEILSLQKETMELPKYVTKVGRGVLKEINSNRQGVYAKVPNGTEAQPSARDQLAELLRLQIANQEECAEIDRELTALSGCENPTNEAIGNKITSMLQSHIDVINPESPTVEKPMKRIKRSHTFS